jgi:hypothetical protein
LGDSALAVDILVALINTLGLTEFVSDALTRRKQKEAETNAKIVDLFKDALDEIKNCRNEQQRVEFHIALACVMPPRGLPLVYHFRMFHHNCGQLIKNREKS